MLGILTGFVQELRAVGIPVSMVEAIDGAAALRHVDLGDRGAVRAALGATLVKNSRHQRAFDIAFDVYFGLAPGAAVEAPADDEAQVAAAASGQPAGAGGSGEADALFEAILTALTSGDSEALRALVGRAVDQLSGLEPGRPVGGRYYFYRVMRRLGAEAMTDRLLEALAGVRLDAFDERLARQDAAELTARFEAELRREIVRRLVADRGPRAVAKTLRLPLVEDIDLMHATREELAEIERVVTPLAQRLATRLSQRRRRGRRGRLDVRRTIRRSLAHGGVLLEPQFKPPRISKPELVLLCDISGSMATFARFTMQLTYAVSNQFSKVRSFAFIDGIDEVTGFFGPGQDFHDSLVRMGREADVVWRDGHSDYGNALTRFWDGWEEAITPRSTVLVTGDARNNYRDTGLDAIASIADRARALFWLNPEAQRYWDTGDSIMSTYAPFCDGVHQVRTLRQLEHFVEAVALPRSRPRATMG